MTKRIQCTWPDVCVYCTALFWHGTAPASLQKYVQNWSRTHGASFDDLRAVFLRGDCFQLAGTVEVLRYVLAGSQRVAQEEVAKTACYHDNDLDLFRFQFSSLTENFETTAHNAKRVFNRIMDFSLPRPFAPGSESSRCGTFAPWDTIISDFVVRQTLL